MFAQKGANGDKAGRLLAFSSRNLYSRDLSCAREVREGESWQDCAGDYVHKGVECLFPGYFGHCWDDQGAGLCPFV